MFSVTILGFLVLLAQAAPPSWSELGQLGVVALALIVGAVGAGWAINKWGLQPMTKLYEQERLDRIAAQSDTKEALQVTIPVVAQANANHAAMLSMLSRGEGQR